MASHARKPIPRDPAERARECPEIKELLDLPPGGVDPDLAATWNAQTPPAHRETDPMKRARKRRSRA